MAKCSKCLNTATFFNLKNIGVCGPCRQHQVDYHSYQRIPELEDIEANLQIVDRITFDLNAYLKLHNLCKLFY